MGEGGVGAENRACRWGLNDVNKDCVFSPVICVVGMETRGRCDGSYIDSFERGALLRGFGKTREGDTAGGNWSFVPASAPVFLGKRARHVG